MNKNFLIFSALFTLISFSVEAKMLYVDHSTGNDSVSYAENGPDQPWATIGRAAWGSTNRNNPYPDEAAQAGDTVSVAAGTYTAAGTNDRWAVVYNPANSGTPGNPITFEAVGTVILQHSSGTGPSIGTSSRDYITWRGFTINEIDALGAPDTGVAVLHVTTGSTIENCIIDGYDNGRMGSNHNGIRLTCADNITIKNNKIYNVLNFGTYGHNGAGIMTYGAENIIIEHNEFYNNGAAIFIKGDAPCPGYPSNRNYTIRYNKIYTTDAPNGSKGIDIGTMREGTTYIYQNVIYDVYSGILLDSQVHALDGTFYIVNNTIQTSGDVSGVYFDTRLSGADPTYYVQNNIVYSQSSGSAEVAVNAWSWDSPSYFTFDYNDYYNANWALNGLVYGSIANWRTALGGCPGGGNDCNSILSDPGFVNQSDNDYRLQIGSPARDLGVDILDLDRDGSTTDRITVGAYITGNEVIGPGIGPEGPIAPRNFRLLSQ